MTIQVNPKKLLAATASPELFNYNILMLAPDAGCIYKHLPTDDEKLLSVIEKYKTADEIEQQLKNKYLVESAELNNGFHLMVFTNKDTLLKGTESILWTTLFIVLICLVFSIILINALSSTLTKRIKNLNQKIEKVKSGDFDIEIQSEYNDEIGDLTNNFYDMSEQIKLLIADIYESQRLQQKAELKALQSQIKPHFLYNTLQAVNWNSIEHEDYNTSSIVVNLSNFYRGVLNKGDDDISVNDEVKITEYYLNIENLIYNNLFKVTYDISPSVLHYKIIPLILQPLVENAIEHGFRKTNVENAEIKISAFTENGNLVFTVSDNGLGIEEYKRNIILTQETKGYGIKNINDRIKLKFGEEYGIHITSYQNPTEFKVVLPICNDK